MAGKMRGRLIDLAFGVNGKQRVTIELDRDFRDTYDTLSGQELDVTIAKHRNLRSKDANAYFHVLVNEIAAVKGGSDDQTKAELVRRYGAIAVDKNGEKVGMKLPENIDPDTVYPYTRCFDVRVENGTTFKCYLLYKRTRAMDSAEMARLIDGTIEEAKELGIQTDTPEQIAKYKELWKKQ